jgi:hypothetical protein
MPILALDHLGNIVETDGFGQSEGFGKDPVFVMDGQLIVEESSPREIYIRKRIEEKSAFEKRKKRFLFAQRKKAEANQQRAANLKQESLKVAIAQKQAQLERQKAGARQAARRYGQSAGPLDTSQLIGDPLLGFQEEGVYERLEAISDHPLYGIKNVEPYSMILDQQAFGALPVFTTNQSTSLNLQSLQNRFGVARAASIQNAVAGRLALFPNDVVMDVTTDDPSRSGGSRALYDEWMRQGFNVRYEKMFSGANVAKRALNPLFNEGPYMAESCGTVAAYVSMLDPVAVQAAKNLATMFGYYSWESMFVTSDQKGSKALGSSAKTGARVYFGRRASNTVGEVVQYSPVFIETPNFLTANPIPPYSLKAGIQLPVTGLWVSELYLANFAVMHFQGNLEVAWRHLGEKRIGESTWIDNLMGKILSTIVIGGLTAGVGAAIAQVTQAASSIPVVATITQGVQAVAALPAVIAVKEAVKSASGTVEEVKKVLPDLQLPSLPTKSTASAPPSTPVPLAPPAPASVPMEKAVTGSTKEVSPWIHPMLTYGLLGFFSSVSSPRVTAQASAWTHPLLAQGKSS